MTTSSKPDQLNARSQTLLKKLIQHYVRSGQPVGSRTLSRDSELGLSPATIRNVMADLEEVGLICSPHTSAGRIPTVSGYRLFVDTLLQVQPLAQQETQQLQQLLDGKHSEQDLLTQASTLLSDITHFTGVVMLPRYETKNLRHVEFLALSEKRVLVILVINEQEVENRIIHTNRAYSKDELQQAANYLNQVCLGKEIKTVLANLKKELKEAQDRVSNWLNTALEMVDKAVEQDPDPAGYVLAGQTNLMDIEELASLDTLKHLFSAFNQKRDMLQLLDQSLQAQGVQIFIGEESGYQLLDECSIVTAPYQVDQQSLGVLGVIGPTRMAYERVIPVVDLTARLLGSALSYR